MPDMNPFREVVISLFLLCLSACSTSKYDRLAADFRQRSPKSEAESNYRAHDNKIYSAMGVGRYYPGLSPNVGRRIAREHGEMMLSGTSDVMESRSHANYVGAATEFASAYNKRKASLIAQSAP